MSSSGPPPANPSGPKGSALARTLLKLAGWTVVGERPAAPRYVLIGAPHTSNWDFPIALLVAATLGVRIHWLAKHTLFRPPLGWVMRALGGISVKRDQKQGTVEALAERFQAADRFVLGIAPEGTRSRRESWKSGFYRIAVAAGVPVVLGFVDHSTCTAGLGPVFQPTGDLEADFGQIAVFYADKRGRYPEKESALRIRTLDDSQSPAT